MTRIAVGAFLHETNTFAPTKATYDDFVHGGGWPSMAHGADVLKVMRNINVGLPASSRPPKPMAGSWSQRSRRRRSHRRMSPTMPSNAS